MSRYRQHLKIFECDRLSTEPNPQFDLNLLVTLQIRFLMRAPLCNTYFVPLEFSVNSPQRYKFIINMVVKERNFRYDPLICPVQTPLQ